MIAFGGAAAPPGAVFRSHTTRLVSLVRLALVAVALLFAPLAPALEVPELTGRVVDTAKVLSPDASARIERLLAAQEKETGQQFALLTVPTLDGQPIENFSIAVVDQWKLGQKGNDDGLLLLIVPKDKKVRIEVGRGLEGDVTDAISARVIRNVIGPAFRAGDYAGGVEKAFSALMRAASGKVPDIPDADTSPEVPNIPGSLLLFVLGIVLLPVVIGSIWGSRGSRGTTFYGGPAGYGGGGGFGGGDGGGFSGGGGGFGGGGASGSW